MNRSLAKVGLRWIFFARQPYISLPHHSPMSRDKRALKCMALQMDVAVDGHRVSYVSYHLVILCRSYLHIDIVY